MNTQQGRTKREILESIVKRGLLVGDYRFSYYIPIAAYDAIEEMMEIYLQQEISKAKGLRWVKASERLPEVKRHYPCKDLIGNSYFTKYLSQVYELAPTDDFYWLDESSPLQEGQNEKHD